MILTYRQKLRPTKAQHRLLDERLERQRLLYNAALQERRDAWRLARKGITRIDQQKSLTLIRADDPEGHGGDPVTMGRWTLKRVDDAMAGFFSRAKKGGRAGFPRFKPMSRWRTFGLLEATGLRHEGDRIRLKGIDRPIRLNHDRPLPSDARVLGVTFTKEGGHWYVGFTVETVEVMARPRPRARRSAATSASRRCSRSRTASASRTSAPRPGASARSAYRDGRSPDARRARPAGAR